MNLRNMILCILLLVVSGCTQKMPVDLPDSVLIFSIETPSDITEIKDTETIEKFVEIFSDEQKNYLVEESDFDSRGVITVIFKSGNDEKRYSVYEQSTIGDYSYFQHLDSGSAYKVSSEAYDLIVSYLP